MPLKLDTYIVTNADIVPGRDHIEGAREALQGGADVIQFREKKMDTGEMIHVCEIIQNLCRQHGAIFIVDDRVDVALAMDAEADGADYVGTGIIFPAGVKKEIGVAKGVAVLREVSGAVQVPVVAIGGIDHGNATSCIGAGAGSCAVITAVIGAPDVRQAATNLAQIIRDAKMRVGKRRPM